MIQDDAERDDDSQEECCDERVEKKTFTKISFKEPMKRLLTALSKLRNKLSNRHDISLLLDKVLNEYNDIAEMTTHGGRFEILDQDTGDNDGSNNDDRRSDDTGDSSSRSSDSRKTIPAVTVMKNTTQKAAMRSQMMKQMLMTMQRRKGE